MRRIHKWQVPITDMFTILMPIGSGVLTSIEMIERGEWKKGVGDGG